MKRLSIPEVLKSLENKSQEDIINILKKNDTRSLRHVLYVAFSKDIIINLPETRPVDLKLSENPIGLTDSNLYRESRKFRIFLKGNGYDNLPKAKVESLFIGILESIHSDESELLLQIFIDRCLKSSVTYQNVLEAFPGLLPNIQEPPTVKEEPKKIERTVVYKDMADVYEKNKKKSEKKTKTKKKSSKKKSK